MQAYEWYHLCSSRKIGMSDISNMTWIERQAILREYEKDRRAEEEAIKNSR